MGLLTACIFLRIMHFSFHSVILSNPAAASYTTNNIYT